MRSSLPALVSVTKADHENTNLENCKEKQAKNTYEMLWSSKQNNKVAAHENCAQTDKKDEIQTQIILGPPMQPTSDVGDGWSQPSTPGTT